MIGASSLAAAAVIVLLFVSMPSSPSSVLPTMPDQPSDALPTMPPAANEPATTGNPVVAVINGEEIRADKVKETQQLMQVRTGVPVDSAAAMDRLVDNVLLLHEAESRGIEVDRTEAQTLLDQQLMQGGLTPEEFDSMMMQQGVSYDKVVDMFQDDLTISELFEDELLQHDIEVTHEESVEFFEQNLAMIQMQLGEDVSYEAISEQIDATILQQKQQQLASEFIDLLRDNAQITVH